MGSQAPTDAPATAAGRIAAVPNNRGISASDHAGPSRSRRAGRENSRFSVEANAVLDEIRRLLDRHPGDARLAALRLVALLTSRAATELGNGRGGLAPWQRRKVDRFLRDHLCQPVRIEQLAAQIPLSASHFCRAFKQTLGLTPHKYMVQLRLQLAQRLMLTTREPLSQIAISCGLADQAHLAKLFRRQMGERPSAWRRRHLADARHGPIHRARDDSTFAGSRRAPQGDETDGPLHTTSRGPRQ